MGQRLSSQECEQVRRNYRLEQSELDAWVRVFKRNARRFNSAVMDLDGFKQAFAGSNESDESLTRMFHSFDWNGDGEISFNEFMFAVLMNSRVPTRAKLRYAFDMIDKDGNGFIDKYELRDMVFNVCSTKSMLMFEVDTFSESFVFDTFNKMDTNGDGQLSREEFEEQVMRHGKWILRLLDVRL